MIYFTAHTFKCVCHCRRVMFRVLGMYNFALPLKNSDVLNGWSFKVGTFLEDHKILRNLHRRFDRYSIGQIYGGDFGKFCGLLRIDEF